MKHGKRLTKKQKLFQEIEFFTLWEEEEFKETFPHSISQVVKKETV